MFLLFEKKEALLPFLEILTERTKEFTWLNSPFNI